LYNKLIYFKTSFFDKTPIGQLVTRAVGDVETIATVYTDGFLMVFGDVLRIFCTGDDVQYQCSSQLYYIGDFTFNGRDYKIFPEKAEKAFGDERNWTSNQNSFVQERLAGMPIIQVFNRQEAEFKSLMILILL
jgi:ABC-type multidrug transport system fused ATPase/permease subunit